MDDCVFKIFQVQQSKDYTHRLICCHGHQRRIYCGDMANPELISEIYNKPGSKMLGPCQPFKLVERRKRKSTIEEEQIGF